MGKNSDYKPVQIKKDAYIKLKQYCTYNSLKMGDWLSKLIIANCQEPKPSTTRILKVENK